MQKLNVGHEASDDGVNRTSLISPDTHDYIEPHFVSCPDTLLLSGVTTPKAKPENRQQGLGDNRIHKLHGTILFIPLLIYLEHQISISIMTLSQVKSAFSIDLS